MALLRNKEAVKGITWCEFRMAKAAETVKKSAVVTAKKPAAAKKKPAVKKTSVAGKKGAVSKKRYSHEIQMQDLRICLFTPSG